MSTNPSSAYTIWNFIFSYFRLPLKCFRSCCLRKMNTIMFMNEFSSSHIFVLRYIDPVPAKFFLPLCRQTNINLVSYHVGLMVYYYFFFFMKNRSKYVNNGFDDNNSRFSSFQFSLL